MTETTPVTRSSHRSTASKEKDAFDDAVATTILNGGRGRVTPSPSVNKRRGLLASSEDTSSDKNKKQKKNDTHDSNNAMVVEEPHSDSTHQLVKKKDGFAHDDHVPVSVDTKSNDDNDNSIHTYVTSKHKDTVYWFRSQLYPSYPSACQAKREWNQSKLNSLGLGGSSMVASMGGGKKKKKKPAKKKNPTTPLAPVRTSARRQGKKPDYTGELIDEGGIESVAIRGPSIARRKLKKAANAAIKPLTEEQLATLASATEWLDDFEHFLLHVPHGKNFKVCSDQNCKSIMRQTLKMVSGQGVTYTHWLEGIVWMKDTPLRLSDDMVKLHQEAQEFEDVHGEDRGHGWLTRHPLEKLRCYQEYKVNNGNKK